MWSHLRACTLLGSTCIQLIKTPFVTSSFQSTCGSISFPSINMPIINVVTSSVDKAIHIHISHGHSVSV